MRTRRLLALAALAAALATAQVTSIPAAAGGGGGGGVGAVNVTATGSGSVTSLAITITSLNLTSIAPAVIQCWTAAGVPVAITGYTTAGTAPITTVTPTFSATSNPTCVVNSNGGAGPAGPTSTGWNLTLNPVMGVTQYQFGTNNTTFQTSTTNSNGWNVYMIANCNPYAGFSMSHCGNYVSRYQVNGDGMGGTAGGAGYWGDLIFGGTSSGLGSLNIGSEFHFNGFAVGTGLTILYANAFDCDADATLSGTLTNGACYRAGLPGIGITNWGGIVSGSTSPAPIAGKWAFTHVNLADVFGPITPPSGSAGNVELYVSSADNYLHGNYTNEGDFPITRTIASGATAMGTSSIASGACSTAVTVSATGVLATDTITFAPNVDPTSVTGYAASASGSLYIWPYPTAGNVNFKVCNNTGTSQTPSALTLNWKVPR